MPFSRCDRVIERVSCILDGEASMLERMRFQGHLAMCVDCTRYYEQFKTVKNAAGEVTIEDLPTDFERVMDFVLEEVKDD